MSSRSSPANKQGTPGSFRFSSKPAEAWALAIPAWPEHATYGLGNPPPIRLSYGTDLILLANFSKRLDFAPILLRCASLHSSPFSGKGKVSSSKPVLDEKPLASLSAARCGYRLCRFLLCAALCPAACLAGR